MKILRSLDYLPQKVAYDYLKSPVGKLIIITSIEGLHAILWEEMSQGKYYQDILAQASHDEGEMYINQTRQQLQEYFQRRRVQFDLPLVLNGTIFQKLVWQQLMQIPYGKTISYAAQAELVGDRKKARAVGNADGVNPIPIIIPCHRVIGSNGSLTGFGGGMANKKFLLELECERKSMILQGRGLVG